MARFALWARFRRGMHSLGRMAHGDFRHQSITATSGYMINKKLCIVTETHVVACTCGATWYKGKDLTFVKWQA